MPGLQARHNQKAGFYSQNLNFKVKTFHKLFCFLFFNFSATKRNYNLISISTPAGKFKFIKASITSGVGFKTSINLL